MAYKGKMTVADILCRLRQEAQATIEDYDDAQDTDGRLRDLLATLYVLEGLAEQTKDGVVATLVDDMLYSIHETLMGAKFKAHIPPAEVIRSKIAAGDAYDGVQSTLVRRVVLRPELRPLPYVTVTEAQPRERIDPEWAAIAWTRGPYQEAYDILFYRFEGTLLMWFPASSLDEAVSKATQIPGIRPDEWEACQVELTDEDGRMPWTTQEEER